MWEVFNLYGDRSENAESNYKCSRGKIQKENKVLGENIKVIWYLEIRCPK